MKQTPAILERFNRLMPQGVTPKFSTVAEWQAWQQAEAQKRCSVIDAQNRQTRATKLLGRSGIQELHKRCTFTNYRVNGDGQRQAFSAAKAWLDRFGTTAGGFIFSGLPGTGKNHLAAAIGNQLLARGKTVVIITVADLMTKLRACYDGEGSESELIDGLCDADLLVVDEVGLQRDTRNERIILNQIVDRRTASRRPVGILTNLGPEALTQLLGERVMDRMKMDHGVWVKFDWVSYRAQVGAGGQQK